MSEFFKAEDFVFGEGAFSCASSADVAAKANRLLKERATVVYKMENSAMEWHKGHLTSDTHQALLINVQPIEKPDTAEQLLYEALSSGDLQGKLHWQSWCDRVRKLLSK